MGNRETFVKELTAQYEQLFHTPEYAAAAVKRTPEQMAYRMTAGLREDSVSKDGAAVKAVCKNLGIKHTYTAIKEYLNQS